ncbi:MAG TPA: 2-C-methyl-D-erythritol 4-phosphate cytidylyltransferase [Mycobacteriales bacterium]|nr:2-C-methyl-D-erythritol 4-phosphate cytidylyltransferase [Mycobacteriales bacterium]
MSGATSTLRQPGLLLLVPVLPWAGRSDGVPVAAVRLRGVPLFVHAVRAVADALGSPVVAAAPESVRAVTAALAAAGLRDVPVVPAGDRIGSALVRVLDRSQSCAEPVEAVLVHDPRCPLTPPSCLRDAAAAAACDPGAVVVAARAMTDTVKELVDGVVRATVDRDGLRVVASPLVLPVALLRSLDDAGLLENCADVDALVQVVRAAGARLVWISAPAHARRVGDAASVAVLECLTDVR